MVVWEDDQNLNDNYNIYARGFLSGGEEMFPDMAVKSKPSRQQFRPAVAMDEDGRSDAKAGDRFGSGVTFVGDVAIENGRITAVGPEAITSIGSPTGSPNWVMIACSYSLKTFSISRRFACIRAGRKAERASPDA